MRVLNSSIVIVALACMAASAWAAPPKGWTLAGSDPGSYTVAVDTTSRHGGRASAALKATAASANGFGTLMQTIGPGAFAGKRVRLSGWVKAIGVAGWAGLWMRVDGAGEDPLAFDNMAGRPIKGSKDWTRYEVVLDVDRDATKLAFGVLLGGNGSVWTDDFKLEVVDRRVPTTDLVGSALASTPQNIGFEE